MERYAVIFFAVWVLMAIPSVIFALRGISKARKTFDGVDIQPIKYREKGASGYSKRSFITRIGGANKVLDIILTDSELCIMGINSLFSFIGSFYDLSHRIKRENILNIQKVKSQVEIRFITASGKHTEVVLMLKNGDQFLSAVKG